MSAAFDSSTSRLNMSDGDDRKSKANTKRIRCLTILLLVLVMLSIVFMVLYVKTDQKNEKLKTENSGIFTFLFFLEYLFYTIYLRHFSSIEKDIYRCYGNVNSMEERQIFLFYNRVLTVKVSFQ